MSNTCRGDASIGLTFLMIHQTIVFDEVRIKSELQSHTIDFCWWKCRGLKSPFGDSISD